MRTFIISLVLALLAVTPAVPAAQDAKIVYIGEVSQDALRKLKRYKPLTAYLDARLGSKGYKFKTMMPKDLTQAADFLQTGRLDIFIDSVAPMYYTSGVLEARARAAGKPEVGMTIGCRRWKKGVREYTSVILTRKKDGVAKLAELKGKIMGFDDPWSTSGYFLPRAALQEAGLVLHRIEKAGEPAQADKVSYAFFEGSEKAVSFLMA